MNDKVLESVIEITEQKNSLALSYSILATLSELLPLSTATLFHHLGRSTLMVARLIITKNAAGKRSTSGNTTKYVPTMVTSTLNRKWRFPNKRMANINAFARFR